MNEYISDFSDEDEVVEILEMPQLPMFNYNLH